MVEDEQPKSSDWSIDESNEENQPKESFGKAALYALPRIGKDAWKNATDFASELPENFEASKTSIPSAFNSIINDPMHALKQVAAGFTQFGNDSINLPRGIADYSANRLNLIPQSVAQRIPQERNISSEINQAFGPSNTPGDQLLRVIGENPLAVLGVPAALKALNPLKWTSALNRIKPGLTAESLQNTHNMMHQEASGLYDQVKNAAKDRGIDTVPVDPELIAQARTPGYFPKTKASRDLINNAATGNYEALHKLQSDMGKRSRNKMSSEFAADNDVGEEMHELRNNINQGTSDHFKSTGNEDLADALNKGRSKYAKFKDLFYGKNTSTAIKNLVNPDFLKVPDNIMNVLSENSKPMQKIRSSDPFVEKQVNKYQAKQKSINSLKNIGTGLAGGGAALAGVNYITKQFE